MLIYILNPNITGGAKMAVSYMKLWHLLLDKKMTRSELEKLSGVSHYTMTQMGKDKDVSTEALRNICFALDCKLDDIMEFIPDDSEQTQ